MLGLRRRRPAPAARGCFVRMGMLYSVLPAWTTYLAGGKRNEGHAVGERRAPQLRHELAQLGVRAAAEDDLQACSRCARSSSTCDFDFDQVSELIQKKTHAALLIQAGCPCGTVAATAQHSTAQHSTAEPPASVLAPQDPAGEDLAHRHRCPCRSPCLSCNPTDNHKAAQWLRHVIAEWTSFATCALHAAGNSLLRSPQYARMNARELEITCSPHDPASAGAFRSARHRRCSSRPTKTVTQAHRRRWCSQCQRLVRPALSSCAHTVPRSAGALVQANPPRSWHKVGCVSTTTRNRSLLSLLAWRHKALPHASIVIARLQPVQLS